MKNNLYDLITVSCRTRSEYLFVCYCRVRAGYWGKKGGGEEGGIAFQGTL